MPVVANPLERTGKVERKASSRLLKDRLAKDLQKFVKGQLGVYKYACWIEFVRDLPKTVTGKIQRYKLRG